MADEVLLRAVRRYWDESQVDALYERILAAYAQRLEDVTVIVGKGAEGDSASAQVVIGRADYKEWMDTLETILQEKKAARDGTCGPPEGSHTLSYSGRVIEP